MSTAAVKRYWSQLVEGGCILCGGPAEIAHAHGASIVERMQEPKAKGKKLPRLDWLVLPLCPWHHRIPLMDGCCLDDAPVEWEREYAKQADWIDMLCHRHGIDLWAKARTGRK